MEKTIIILLVLLANLLISVFAFGMQKQVQPGQKGYDTSFATSSPVTKTENTGYRVIFTGDKSEPKPIKFTVKNSPVRPDTSTQPSPRLWRAGSSVRTDVSMDTTSQTSFPISVSDMAEAAGNMSESVPCFNAENSNDTLVDFDAISGLATIAHDLVSSVITDGVAAIDTKLASYRAENKVYTPEFLYKNLPYYFKNLPSVFQAVISFHLNKLVNKPAQENNDVKPIEPILQKAEKVTAVEGQLVQAPIDTQKVEPILQKVNKIQSELLQTPIDDQKAELILQQADKIFIMPTKEPFKAPAQILPIIENKKQTATPEKAMPKENTNHPAYAAPYAKEKKQIDINENKQEKNKIAKKINNTTSIAISNPSLRQGFDGQVGGQANQAAAGDIAIIHGDESNSVNELVADELLNDTEVGTDVVSNDVYRTRTIKAAKKIKNTSTRPSPRLWRASKSVQTDVSRDKKETPQQDTDDSSGISYWWLLTLVGELIRRRRYMFI